MPSKTPEKQPTTKTKAGGGKSNALQKPLQPSPELAAVVGPGSLPRTEVVKGMAAKAGVTMKDVYWTLGTYDIVGIFEAPDEVSITALGLSIGALGNVRTQTMRAYDRSEMEPIVSKAKTWEVQLVVEDDNRNKRSVWLDVTFDRELPADWPDLQ